MPLHPQAVEFLRYAAGQPKLHTLTPEQARAALEAGAATIGDGPHIEAVTDLAVAVPDGTVPVRAYRPANPGAAVVWLHGGLWVAGGLATHDAMCRALADAAQAIVVSVDYRLAPEHPFPAPLDDCWEALRWAAAMHPSLPLVVGGDSAGANMAAVCAVRARDRGGPAPALQVLVYPMTDAAMDTPSYAERGGDDTLLGAKDVVWSYDHYAPVGVDRADPEVSPLRAPDLAGVAPAIVLTDEYDPLRDEGRAYATRLRDAGVAVTEHRYDDMMHAFFQFVNVFARADEAVAQVGAEIAAATGAAQSETAVATSASHG
ncbi:MAG TPA: alpha/beta hydrolase [Solirubrobacteraceae bacterium]|jgi:acetyl esterase|nr:alpha/beta hydrolase [Solirubrobacteraceae bacterium]